MTVLCAIPRPAPLRPWCMRPPRKTYAPPSPPPWTAIPCAGGLITPTTPEPPRTPDHPSWSTHGPAGLDGGKGSWPKLITDARAVGAGRPIVNLGCPAEDAQARTDGAVASRAARRLDT